MKTPVFGVAACLVIFGTGCTFPSSKRIVSQRQAGQVHHIEYGTIEKVNEVVIAGDRGPIGLYGGAAMGVAATGNPGHVHGQNVAEDVAQVAAGIGGAVAGQAVEEVVTRKGAQEMVIKLDSGVMVVITQPTQPGFNVGERVALASGPGGAYVMAP